MDWTRLKRSRPDGGKSGVFVSFEPKGTNAAPVEELEESNSMDQYESLMGKVLAKKRPKTSLSKKTEASSSKGMSLETVESSLPQNWMLCKGAQLQARQEADLEWTESTQPEASYYQHPCTELPGSILGVLNKLRAQVGDSLHAQFRMDGGAEIDTETAISTSQNSSATDTSLFMSSTRRGEEISSNNTTMAARSEEADAAAFVLDMRCTWGDSFRSLLHFVLKGRCPYFYYVEKEGQNNSFIVLFIGQGVVEKGFPVCALTSKSSKGFRMQLSKCCVEFESPLDPSIAKGLEAKVEADLHDELLAYSRTHAPHSNAAKLQLTRASSMGVEDDARSLLFFRGAQSVSGLHCMLLNRIVKRAGSHNVPKLLSPVQFPNAVPRGGVYSAPSRTLRLASTTLPLRQESELVVSVRLDDILLPDRIPRLLSSMGQASRGDVQVELNLDPQTAVFNEALATVLAAFKSRPSRVKTLRRFSVNSKLLCPIG